MNLINNKYFKSTIKSYKKLFIYIIICLSFLFTLSYSHYRYNNLLNSFKANFNNYKFSEANNLIVTKESLNPFKIICLKNDLHSYFNDKLSIMSNNLKDKDINDILIQLREIDHYKIISPSRINYINDSIFKFTNSVDYYTQGINYYINKDYENAWYYFNNVSFLDINYSNSLGYINQCKKNIKNDIYLQCDELIKNDYYTKALNLLSEYSSLINDDKAISKKIQEVKTKRQDYLNNASSVLEASSKALTTTISPNNINTLNITSDTNFLINVDINNQKTYVYEGKSDNWTLLKTFSCSTGIDGENTPVGSFSIKEKGEWFFSDEYNQGGKYWSQITGDILFHSLPYSNDRTTIVDYTVNKPSSHGCIRLYLDDAKWIYENVPRDSKVIIK